MSTYPYRIPGQLLREIRTAKGVMPETVADHCRVQFFEYMDWETGRKRPTPAEFSNLIARLLPSKGQVELLCLGWTEFERDAKLVGIYRDVRDSWTGAV